MVSNHFNLALRFTHRVSWEFSSQRCCILARRYPNLAYAADAHYHHLTDDIIEGGYSELYKRLGGYSYDQDPLRPGWTPTVPNNRWADPNDARTSEIPCIFKQRLSSRSK